MASDASDISNAQPGAPAAPSAIPRSTRRQAAVRILACITAAAETVTDGRFGGEVVAVLHSQMKLQALDFWMRNPDYLADELLNEFEKKREKAFLKAASDILDSREPELHRFPMIRYRFGAFEPLDDALALLRSADLVRLKRQIVGNKVREHIYLLTDKGAKAMQEMAASSPELNWYLERAKLIATVAGDAGGTALKERQYKQLEYAATELKATIAAITPRVRARLEQLRRQP